MRKVISNKKQRALIAVTVLITTMFLSACTKSATFNGSKTGDADHFDIDFEVLNASYSHELEMKEGEALDVMIEAESGTISLLIQKDDDTPIYRGTNLESARFLVGVDSEGTYTLTVTGKMAKGHVIISRAQ